jgi:hypothetical protein
MNEPLDPREQLRKEFEQLRVEISELGTEQSAGGDPPSGGGFRGRARASLAALALTAAVAAAAGNFALNGGRTSKDGSVSVPPPSNGPEPVVSTVDRGSAEPSLSLLSVIGPGLQAGILGSNAGLPGGSSPTTGPSPVFVVGDPISGSVHGSRGGDVNNADSVGHSPAPTPTPLPPEPEPHEPTLAFSPPPAPAGGTGGGPGNGEEPGEGGQSGEGGGQSGEGGHTASPALEEDDSGGGGEGKGHIKAKGKGHGGSQGKGHEKDPEGGEVVESDSGGNGSPAHHPGGHGRGKGRGAAPPAPPPPPADPGPPPPAPGPKGSPGKSEDAGHGKSTAPGQVGK